MDDEENFSPEELAAFEAVFRATPAKRLAAIRRWKSANPEKQAEYQRRHAAKRRLEGKRSRVAEYHHRQKLIDPEGWRTYLRPHRAVQKAKRRARLRKAQCVCCKPKDFREVYARAQATGGEVDHDIPLALGGLHCVHNLNVLSRQQHAEKTSQDRRAMARLRRP